VATSVSICSNALIRLGADPISSFDEADQTGSNIERARLAANLWPTVRRQVLRSHPWNVALRRVLLSPDSESPAFGYGYRFMIPSDWLRTIAVGREETDRLEYRTESGFILSNEAEFPLLYVFDNTNPTTYDAMLVGAMELAMQAALAYPVTKSTSLAGELAIQLRDMLAQARGIDAQDDPPDRLGDFPQYASRFGRRGVGG
jgi:hypothetical protein